MDMSIFEVVGPVMVGPSSSHTAGAVKLGRIARLICGQPFSHVSFGLYGSFAKTYKGHGTDKALVAGILGLCEDDERMVNSFEIAREKHITFEFYETDLEGMHENSAEITFKMKDKVLCRIVGSSIGGGQVIIKRIGDYELEMTAQLPTLIIKQHDKKGIVSDISTILANNNINIGVMRLNRKRKGEAALCIMETDEEITERVLEDIRKLNNVIEVKAINV